ncbi:MAG: hypothetical protein EA414_06055 [Arthrospira sp. PLM2.Bin9]|nr:MAG: hypothetical protein EA414_06055 [Arthrospira sp. PLM2.Bin9]
MHLNLELLRTDGFRKCLFIPQLREQNSTLFLKKQPRKLPLFLRNSPIPIYFLSFLTKKL